MAFFRRILFVDDDSSYIKNTEPYFETKGIKITAVKSIPAALKIFEKESFDAYLIDLDLGGGELGTDLIKKIRERDELTPIFILSAHVGEQFWEDKLNEVELMVTAIYSKPLPLVSSPKFDLFFQKIENSIKKTFESEFDRKYRSSSENTITKFFREIINPSMNSEISPINLLKIAIKAVPSVKYALGVGGIAAVVAIIAGFNIDYRVAVFGTLIIFVLMFVLLLFSYSSKYLGNSLKNPAIVVTWSFSLITIIVACLFITSYFFDWPKAFEVIKNK